VVQGFHCSYSDCCEEEARNYKMQQQLHNQLHHTYSEDRVARILARRIEREIEGVLGKVWIQKKKRN